MNWEKLDLHIENMIPGLVLLTIALLGWPPNLGQLASQKVIIATAFVALAYMLGALANLLARLFLDFVCKRTIRQYFMRFFLRDRLGLGAKPTRTAIDDRYSLVIDAGLSCGNERVASEVAKRRQTARIVRSALIPTLLGIWVLGAELQKSVSQRIVIWIAAYVSLLLLYAYSEVTIFQEGNRGLRMMQAHDSASANEREH
jgi:hypothetical protein